MDDVQPKIAAPKYEDLASLVEHTLLSTALSETDMSQGSSARNSNTGGAHE